MSVTGRTPYPPPPYDWSKGNWREAFLVRPGYVIQECDFNSMEMQIYAHYADLLTKEEKR